MNAYISHTRTPGADGEAAHARLRRQLQHLRLGIERYETAYGDWQRSHTQRSAQAEVRFHVIEAQLARLSEGEVSGGNEPPDSLENSQPIVLSIAAYRDD